MTGIDYGMGKTNIDLETGFRFGVISSNRLASHAWDEITSKGEDLDYLDAMENLKSELSQAIKSVLEDYSISFDSAELADDIISGIDIELCETGDCTRYGFDSDGLAFNVCSDGDIFVTKSPFYSLSSFCSPCAPGAGYLESEGNVKTYCLPPDWFDSDNPMPYQCFRVSDDSEAFNV